MAKNACAPSAGAKCVSTTAVYTGSMPKSGIPRENVLESDMTDVARDFRSRLRQVLDEKFEEPSDLELMAMMVVRI
jgi:hypothetical protein